MKLFCTLLASLALAWVQMASTVGDSGNGQPQVSATAQHACCKVVRVTSSCCPTPCCVQRTPNAPEPTSPAPASTRSDSGRSLFFAVHFTLLHLLPSGTSILPDSRPAAFGVAVMPSVPLFLRHGSLLV